jgi:hypothetical protein
MRVESCSDRGVLKILRRLPCGTHNLDVVVTNEVTYLITEITFSTTGPDAHVANARNRVAIAVRHETKQVNGRSCSRNVVSERKA